MLGLQNGVGSLGQRRPRHDPHRLARPYDPVERLTGKCLSNHGEFQQIVRSRAERLLAAKSVTIHGGAIERGDGHVGDYISRQDAAGSGMKEDRFRRKRL
jgi:hypothetical protein